MISAVKTATTAPARRAATRSALAALLFVTLAAAPLAFSSYTIYLLNLTAIFGLVALGLNVLTGFAGQISLGHAAFFGIGAYATGLLAEKLGVPFVLALPLAGLATTAVGALAAIPALRLKSLYLAIATLGFGVVVQKILFEWRSLTGGGGGFELTAPRLGPLTLSSGTHMYYLTVAILCFGVWTASNLARLRTGRAMILLRDSEIAAGTLGISVARYKIVAFALSAFYTAIAGGLYAYLVRYINPESFNVDLSISFLSMVVIGGLGTIPGSLLGAVFYVAVPEIFREFKDAPGLVFGASLVLIMVLTPKGLWGFVEPLWRRR
jgi:branched-chain amino acid transport system permease protein